MNARPLLHPSSPSPGLPSQPGRALPFALPILLLAFAATAYAGPENQSLDIYWIDVEGGGATLIVSPQGESVLIDAGNPGVRDASRIHQAATQVAGLKRIDHHVTTHFHIDHFGGAAELAALIPIGTVWNHGIPDGDPDNNPSDTRWRLTSKPYREFPAEARRVIRPGDTLPLKQPANGTPLTLRCVAARQQFLSVPENAASNAACDGRQERPQDTSDNANSVVLVLDFGPFRFFNGGDLTWNTEAALVCPVNRVGEVDVYQVNHHGLDTSNNPVLVRSLAPTVAVMNNGSRKGGDAGTMAALAAAPSIQATFQVHKNARSGAANTAPDQHIANVDPNCKGEWMRLTTDPSGAHYTIAIPSTATERTFASRMNKASRP